MNKVSLEVNGQTHEKTEPTIRDWFNQQTFSEETKDKNIITDKGAAQATIEFVASYFGLSADHLTESELSLDELIKAYKAISENIIGCFIKPKDMAEKETGEQDAAEC